MFEKSFLKLESFVNEKKKVPYTHMQHFYQCPLLLNKFRYLHSSSYSLQFIIAQFRLFPVQQ